MGVTTVLSSKGPECHANTAYAHGDLSGKPAANGIAPRERYESFILRFWVARGVARTSCPRDNSCPEYAANKRCALGVHVRDVINTEAAGYWFPMASQTEGDRADRAVYSHMRSVANGGAFCGCGVVPEVGAFNEARGARNAPLTPAARAVLMAWPDWWRANEMRAASAKRLGW